MPKAKVHLPSFPFYPTDFLGDLNVAPMDAEQVGMYWLLCCMAWQTTPRGTLPNDEKILAGMARVSIEKWREKNGLVLRCFKNKKDTLFQPRLVKIAKEKEAWVKKCQRGGIKSGEVRGKGSSKSSSSKTEVSISLPFPSSSLNTLIQAAPVYGKVKESYFVEMVELFPKVDPVKVLGKLRAWEIDNKAPTKNPSLRIRNWFENEQNYQSNRQLKKVKKGYGSEIGAGFPDKPRA